MTNAIPAKWKKYLLLVAFNLLPEEELLSNIRRYPEPEQSNICRDLRDLVAFEANTNRSVLIVVKIVPPDRFGQLKNFRLERLDQITRLREFLDKNMDSSSEVWYCTTAMNLGDLNVAGRVAFTKEMFPRAHIVEQVWHCSPRLIESFAPDFNHPYVRASRPEWGFRHKIERIHKPPSWEQSEEQLINDFRRSMSYIEKIRSKLVLFLDRIWNVGLASCSIEYKITDYDLRVIDWDTNNDRQIIDALYTDQMRFLQGGERASLR